MKIRVLSDLHLDSHPYEYVRGEEDVLVIAGDTGNGVGAIQRFSETLPADLNVVITLGNHDLYGHVFSDAVERSRNYFSEKENQHFLEKDSVIIDGVKFLGGIMFTDFQSVQFPHPSVIRKVAERCISDFKFIREDTSLVWNSAHHIREYTRFKRWLDFQIKEATEEKIVVVSHFLPHPKSIHEEFRFSDINSYFMSNMEEFFLMKPLTWIHGHTHMACQYDIGDSRVICNPRGYRKESGYTGFNDFVYVEI